MTLSKQQKLQMTGLAIIIFVAGMGLGNAMEKRRVINKAALEKHQMEQEMKQVINFDWGKK